jgi:hypothetical protein
MPLIESPTERARKKNIEEMIKSGKPPKQAVAAGYRNQRQARGRKARGT